jgi:chaperone LolA
MKKILLIITLIASCMMAQSGSAILKKVQNKFKTLQNFTAEFAQEINSANGSNSSKLSGTFYYKRKNKFIVELKNQTITCDGKVVWNYDSRFKRVVISSLANDPTSFSLEKFIFDYPSLCKIKYVKDASISSGEKIIELDPDDQSLQFKWVKIWVSSEGLISKMEVEDRGDISYRFQFSEFRLNQDLPDLKFTYYPPKGTKIIDLR